MTFLHTGETATVTLSTGDAEHQKISLTACGIGRLALGGCACGEIDLDTAQECRCTIPIGAVRAGTLTLTLTVTAGEAALGTITVLE